MIRFVLLFILLSIASPSFAVDKARQIQCLANTIYYEARGEKIEGKKAVGFVVMNRRDHPQKFPNTICKVVSQPRQFSWYPPKRNTVDPASKEIAKNIYYGKYRDNTKGALFFHSVQVRPNWGLERLVSIGRHIFYR